MSAIPDLPQPLAVDDDDPHPQLAQALAERLQDDAAEAAHQVGRTFGAGRPVADHQQAHQVADTLQARAVRQKWS